jgi:hypothetical protein
MGYYVRPPPAYEYHEGDALPGDTPVPQRPGLTYVWNGTTWVVDPALAQAANNAPLMDQLNATDRDSIRSMRNVVNTLARLSASFMPPANTDQAFLVNAEMSARSTRAKIQPPAVLTLAEAKAQKIERLRVQGLAYIGIGFIAQTIRWRATQDQIIYINQCGFLVAGQIITPDGQVHIWDYTGVERALTPLNAGKLVGQLNAWLYVAQQEFWAHVAQVNACTTNAQVDAITWTTTYTMSNPFNADAYGPQGFSKGFDKGFK